MTSSNRDAAIAETLKWEGGYSNNPADPGGPTNWGITIADAKKYWKSNATAADVKAMPKSVAIEIYRNKYWKTPYYDCDKLNAGVDLAVFDFGVNSGPARAKKYLDLSVGGTDEATINKLCDKRMDFLRSLKTFSTFGPGWTNRVAGIRKKAIAMTKASVGGVIAGGTVVVGGAAASTHAPMHWMPWIVGGAIVAGFVIYIVYEYIQYRKKTNA